MKPIRVNKFLMPALVVVALLGSVWMAKAAGLWQTSGRGDVLLDAEGNPDPAGIKGWMTLREVSENYQVPLDALYVMLGAGESVAPETALKDLEKVVEDMEVSIVRQGVTVYLDGSWTPEMGRFGAAASGATEGDLVAPVEPTPVAEPLPAEEHAPVGQGQGDGTGEGFVLPQDGSRVPGADIKGRMTLQEVVAYCQVPLDYLVAELGLPEDVDVRLAMRDLASQMGVEVQAVRDAVTRYQEEH
ncbi:MAG: hypothetical protein JXA93_13815 [Anaerolineae bacterium]|nr:hypothetical protein [Anaerolineae bacterium]